MIREAAGDPRPSARLFFSVHDRHPRRARNSCRQLRASRPRMGSAVRLYYLVDGVGVHLPGRSTRWPPLTRKTDGLPVGAVSGFCNMLWKLMVDAHEVVRASTQPTHLAVVFDKSEVDVLPQPALRRVQGPPPAAAWRTWSRSSALWCARRRGHVRRALAGARRLQVRPTTSSPPTPAMCATPAARW